MEIIIKNVLGESVSVDYADFMDAFIKQGVRFCGVGADEIIELVKYYQINGGDTPITVESIVSVYEPMLVDDVVRRCQEEGCGRVLKLLGGPLDGREIKSRGDAERYMLLVPDYPNWHAERYTDAERNSRHEYDACGKFVKSHLRK